MKTKLIILFLSFNLLGISQIVKMQGKTPQLMNPALVGAFNSGQVNLLTGVSSFSNQTFHYNYLGYNTHINKFKSGIGFNYFKTTDFLPTTYNSPNPQLSSFGLSYSFQQNLGQNWTLSVGATGNYFKKVEDWDELDLQNCINCPEGKVINTNVDLSAGLLIYSNHFYFGMAVLNPSNVNYQMPFTLKVDAGYTFLFKDTTTTLTIGTSIKKVQSFIFTDFQILFKYKLFYFGGGTNPSLYGFNGVNFTTQAGIEYKMFRINYGLVYNGFYYNPNGNTVHELSLQINLPQILKRKSNAFNHLLY